MTRALLFLVLLSGCFSNIDDGKEPGTEPGDDTGTEPGDADTDADADSDTDSDTDPDATDADGDGVRAEDDCDDNDSSVGAETPWYQDLDGDGYGDPAVSQLACEAPGGFVDNDGDCDDLDSTLHPAATEVCDGLDNNCNDQADEGLFETWYPDGDGDGWGDGDAAEERCDDPAGYSQTPGDCDDRAAGVNPAATEICDGVDNDCDGVVDTGAADATTWYADADGDGYGDPDTSVVDCDPGTGWCTDDSDCLDSDRRVNPGATEICDNGVDDNCDGLGTGCILTNMAVSSRTADATFVTPSSDSIGYATRFVGDVNGDGRDDLLSGDAWNSPGSGGFAALGTAGGLGTTNLDSRGVIYTGSGSDQIGHDLAAAGDLDSDGYGDFLITAYGYEGSARSPVGRVYVFHGPQSTGGAIESLADAMLAGANSGAYCDTAAGVGDVDGDGRDDWVGGCKWDSHGGLYAGVSYLVTQDSYAVDTLPSVAEAIIVGENRNDEAGIHVGGGDTDGDGLSDLIIGADCYSDVADDAGAAYTLLSPLTGSISASSADGMLIGETEDSKFGSRVDMEGDIDGDGYADAVVGAWRHLDETGGVWVFLGPVTGNILASNADAYLEGRGIQDQAGHDVSTSGDIDGNGTADILVGAPGYMVDGGAYLVYGPVVGTWSLEDHVILSGATGQSCLGSSVTAGDYDGDGVDDIGIGNTCLHEVHIILGTGW